VTLRIKGKGSVFQNVPVTGALSAALLEWRDIQEALKGRRILAPGRVSHSEGLSTVMLLGAEFGRWLEAELFVPDVSARVGNVAANAERARGQH
jgi:hypothetical protein